MMITRTDPYFLGMTRLKDYIYSFRIINQLMKMNKIIARSDHFTRVNHLLIHRIRDINVPCFGRLAPLSPWPSQRPNPTSGTWVLEDCCGWGLVMRWYTMGELVMIDIKDTKKIYLCIISIQYAYIEVDTCMDVSWPTWKFLLRSSISGRVFFFWYHVQFWILFEIKLC